MFSFLERARFFFSVLAFRQTTLGILVLFAHPVFVLGNVDSAIKSVVDAFDRQEAKVLAFGAYGSSTPVLDFLVALLSELNLRIDYIGSALPASQQSEIDAYLSGISKDIALETGLVYWRPVLDAIREMNSLRVSFGKSQLRVLALGLEDKDLKMVEWTQRRGIFLFEKLRELTNNFEGRGIVVTTPHYLAKGSHVPMTILAQRFLRSPQFVPTAGYLIRNHPSVDSRMLHLWVERQLSGLDFFAHSLPERHPIEKVPLALGKNGSGVIWRTQDSEFLSTEQRIIDRQYFLPNPIYRISEHFDFMISLPDTQLPTANMCSNFLSGAGKFAKGVFLRALSFPYIGL